MFRRLMLVLTAFVVALAATMPIGAQAMPMPSASSGMSADQPCQNCPDQPANTMPDKMPPACQALACAGVLATLPTPVLVPVRAQITIAYAPIPGAPWSEAEIAPDPFPPRPVVVR